MLIRFMLLINLKPTICVAAAVGTDLFSSFVFLHCSFHIQLNYLKSTFIQRKRVNVNPHEWGRQANERGNFILINWRCAELEIYFAAPRVRFSIANKTKTHIFQRRVRTWWKFHIICAVCKNRCRNEKKTKRNSKMTTIRARMRRSKKIVIGRFPKLMTRCRNYW